jgi:hypothetical protein
MLRFGSFSISSTRIEPGARDAFLGVNDFPKMSAN